ncbi:MAG: hypothetical protein HYU66_22675 [Armatimonadetes bacterium]|nr:hypothetical protein [Armatimonadota bacterium]
MRKRLLAVPILLAAALAAAQDNPVTNGGFETLVPHGMAADWEHVGQRGVSYSATAHSGVRSIRFAREPGEQGEVGLNRGWAMDSGAGGKMLSQLKGAIEFWYRVEKLDPDCTANVGLIAMDATPLEQTGEQRRFASMSRRFAGDGQWHRGLIGYDFTANSKVKWVHVAARMVGAGGCDVLVDDLRWLPEAGPLLGIRHTRLVPDFRHPGQVGTLVVTVCNDGDQPIGDCRFAVQLPAGWHTAGPQNAVRGLPPDTYRDVSYPITGTGLGQGRIAVSVRAGEIEASDELQPASDLKLRAVLADPLWFDAGSKVRLQVLADNLGNLPPQARLVAECTGFEPARSEAALQPDAANPRRWRAEWTVTALRGDKHTVAITLLDGGRQVGRETAELAPAGKLAFKLKAGALELARGEQGAVGRLVVGGKVLAFLPHLGRVVYRGARGDREVRAQGLTVSGNLIASKVKDADGGTWTFTTRVEPSALPTATKLTMRVACDRPRQILAVHGPELYAPGERGEALFPGLEWLAPGEISSNDLDIAATHPLCLRLTTHPNNVTIPLMAVATDRGVVGLLWDAHQRWSGALDRPQPVFASPDRWAHQAASRMGLMAPNTVTGLPENRLRCDKPRALGAGEAITLAGHLFAEPGGRDVLDAQDAWFRLYRPEPILNYPRGSLDAELTLDARAYLEALWSEEDQAWWPYHGGPGLGRTVHRSPSWSFDLLNISRLRPQLPLAAAAAQRAEAMLKLAAQPPQAGDDGYFAGDPLEGIGMQSEASAATLASREPDGGWSYQPSTPNSGVFKGMDYQELGEPGQQGNGLFAARLRNVLRAARLAGDLATYREALPSLERLESFSIPRAAQVWEVPVHSPDILAAAEACEAFTEAYRISGEARWLYDARHWARAGLPFVYVWNEPGKPWMRYGSIPVFGATWYQGAWYGRLVQWNGLRYADALLDLATLDPETAMGGLTWREWARGLMVSCMYQQRTDKGYQGLWPDALGCRDKDRANWEFAPRSILRLVYELNGRVEKPLSASLTPGATKLLLAGPAPDRPRVTVSACADITAGSWTGDVVRVSFAQPAAPAAVRATVAGVSRADAAGLALRRRWRDPGRGASRGGQGRPGGARSAGAGVRLPPGAARPDRFRVRPHDRGLACLARPGADARGGWEAGDADHGHGPLHGALGPQPGARRGEDGGDPLPRVGGRRQPVLLDHPRSADARRSQVHQVRRAAGGDARVSSERGRASALARAGDHGDPSRPAAGAGGGGGGGRMGEGGVRGR